ncbi:unnamed protein product [Blepharisma stoltei]|uniref:Uncharacterized protein n=1 Tax=Blepharisma stoltei TaxID=1481888 RepID=A0AAU9JKG2_9CILI|nr:unnamed protein product [Blepharisma stoltei]
MKLKKNGFSPPYHTFQLSSWVATTLELLISSLCIAPFLSKPLTYVFCFSYYPIQILEIIIGIFATLSDPSINKES